MAADLHLIVFAPQDLDDAVVAEAADIAGSVQALAGLRVNDEALAGALGIIDESESDPGAAHIHFPGVQLGQCSSW